MSKQKKIWGIYNVLVDSEKIDQLSEIDIWKKIDNLGGIIFWANHDYDKPWAKDLSPEVLEIAQYNLEFFVYYTRKFGVTFDEEPSETKHVQRSESYNTWFKFWQDHFFNMSEETYKKFIDDKADGKDITKYLPKENWKSLLKTKKASEN